MRKADDHDLRDALSEEVERLEPSDQLWQKIHKRSVSKMEKRPKPWLKGALALGAAAAAAFVLLAGPTGPRPGAEPPAGEGPRTLMAPKGPTTLPAVPEPGTPRPNLPDPSADRLFVRYNHTMYWFNGEAISPDHLGELLTVTTGQNGEKTAPQADGYTNLVEPGKEVRAIKGSDPVRRIAVQTDKGWYVLDNMMQPLPPKAPNE